MDTTANPVIHFDSTRLRPGTAPGSWQLDGLLSTHSSALGLTLDLTGPTALAPDRIGFRARGALPRGQAAHLLARPSPPSAPRGEVA